MKKRVCGIITMCAFLCISPVNASATSFDNINEMLNKINGEDGIVEASECVIDKNTKSLHLSVVISENVPDDEVGTFASKVSGVLSEASQQDWYDYDYVTDDFYKSGYDGVVLTNVWNFKNDTLACSIWDDSLSITRLSDGTKLKEAVLKDVESENSDSQENESLDDTGRLNPGVYIIGEDIPAGKYTFSITDGAGIISVYDSYDDYKNDDYEHSEEYHVASKKYKESLGSDLESINSLYSSEIGNLPLENGMCVKIDTVSVLYLAK